MTMAKRTFFGVLNTDQVNRQNICIPLEALVSGLRRSVRDAVFTGLPIGVPSHIGHDMHRPTGWCISTGILLAADMARQIGAVYEVDPDERAEFHQLLNRFWRAQDDIGTSRFDGDLRDRLRDADLTDAEAVRCEAAGLRRPGLAASLYPHLFEIGRAAVDKDGLTDFSALMAEADEVQPGIFHDRRRDLLLFAHRFFRRSLSHRNALNGYFLSRFSEQARGPALRSRIRLDPDLVGHPASLLRILEFEYWSGPKFRTAIDGIREGVTEYSADANTRRYAGISKTQFWWKAEETRADEAGPARFRTFEAEELVEDAAAGASPETFGCRYTHAEYGGDASSIVHFDGAIRAYGTEAYLERLDKRIDRAGKHSDYTKVFRFDGNLPVDQWQALTADYFRGNTLISEYFGTEEEDPAATSGGPDAGGSPDTVPSLLVCLGFDRARPGEGCYVTREPLKGTDLFWTEKPSPALLARLIEVSSPDDCFLCYADRNVNFPPVGFGSTDLDRLARTTFDALAEALSQDLDVNEVDEVSFTFEWSGSELATRLSVAGRASCVLSLLQAMSGIVCPAQEAARWVGPLRARISEIIHADKPSSQAPAVLISEDGTLRVAHSGTPGLLIPPSHAERLKTVLQDPLALKKGGIELSLFPK